MNPFRPPPLLLLAAALSVSFLHTDAADNSAPPTVAVAVVARENLSREITLQAEFRPYQEIDLHSKVAGYVQSIVVDIGDVVKAGDPIATLEVPELRDDLAHAIAAEQRAESEYKEAHLNYTRLVSVNRSRPNLVAQQELDVAEAKDSAAQAAVAAEKADADKYRALADYTRITAPFAGVITKRYADPGALIQAGTSSDTQSKPLIRLSENSRLRLDFQVSAAYAESVRVGDSVEIRVESVPQPIHGTVSRFSRRIALETRTMEAEVDVPNPDLKLIPGMYATAVLHTQQRDGALSVPVEAVSGTAQPTVYVVSANGRVEERTVTLGLETSTRFEVLSGLKEGERVMIGNRSMVHVGETVVPETVRLAASLP